MSLHTFRDRQDGAEDLARKLEGYRGQDVVVYGLPRGGAVTAKVVADVLGAPLDLVIARKLGHPDNPEYAIGAITDDGDVAMNPEQEISVSRDWLEQEKTAQLAEAKRRRKTYLSGRRHIPVKDKIAIIIDDGIATGYTMEAAIISVRKHHPAKVLVATPVAPISISDRFKTLADEVVVVESPQFLYAIGHWYDEFSPVTDDQVIRLMNEETPHDELRTKATS